MITDLSVELSMVTVPRGDGGAVSAVRESLQVGYHVPLRLRGGPCTSIATAAIAATASAAVGG